MATNSVGLIGGTGPLGRGLALRLAAAGVEVLLGSRDRGRAQEICDALSPSLPSETGSIRGLANELVAVQAGLVIVAIPYEATAATLPPLAAQLTGRVVVSTAVPMEFKAGIPHPLRPAAGSATQEVALLCPGAKVVGAFHTVAARQLQKLERQLDEDCLVTADDDAAKQEVLELVGRITGLRPVDAGGLESAAFSEGLTPFLLRLNRLHGGHTGIRITGL
jgi:hypothetical protein